MSLNTQSATANTQTETTNNNNQTSSSVEIQNESPKFDFREYLQGLNKSIQDLENQLQTKKAEKEGWLKVLQDSNRDNKKSKYAMPVSKAILQAMQDKSEGARAADLKAKVDQLCNTTVDIGYLRATLNKLTQGKKPKLQNNEGLYKLIQQQ